MSDFKVGDKVVRSDMDLLYVSSDIAGRFLSGEVFTVVGVVGHTGDMKLAGLPHSWSQKRFSLVEEDKSNYYKHYEFVCAWMEGKSIQVKSENGSWKDYPPKQNKTCVPCFTADREFRIKPKNFDEADKLKSLVDKLEFQLKEVKEQLKGFCNE